MRRPLVMAGMLAALLGCVGATNQQAFLAPETDLIGVTTLADMLTRERRAGIFFDYLRDSKPLSSRIGDASTSSTVLVPVNKYLMQLPRKPHQGPPPAPGGDVRTSLDQEKDNAAYLEEWVKMHVLATTFDLEQETGQEHATLEEGRKVSFVKGAEGWRLMPGEIPIIDTVQAANGQLFLLDGALSLEHE